MIVNAILMNNPFENPHPTQEHQDASNQGPMHQALDSSGLPQLPESFDPHSSYSDMSLNPAESSYYYGLPINNFYDQHHGLANIPQEPTSYLNDYSMVHTTPNLPPYQAYGGQNTIHHGEMYSVPPYTEEAHPSTMPAMLQPSYEVTTSVPQPKTKTLVPILPRLHGNDPLQNLARTNQISTSSTSNRPPRYSMFHWQQKVDTSVLKELYKRMYREWTPSSRDGLTGSFYLLNIMIDEEPELLDPLLRGDEKAIEDMKKDTKPSLKFSIARARSNKPWPEDSFIRWLDELAPKNVPDKKYEEMMKNYLEGKRHTRWLPAKMSTKSRGRIIEAIAKENGVLPKTVVRNMRNLDRESVMPYLFRILGPNKEDAKQAAIDVYTMTKQLDRQRMNPSSEDNFQATQAAQPHNTLGNDPQIDHGQEHFHQQQQSDQGFNVGEDDWDVSQSIWSPAPSHEAQDYPGRYHGYDTGEGSSRH